jgi:hypothetical protein
MSVTPSPPAHDSAPRWSSFAPALPLLFGVAVLGSLAFALHPPVQIAGDGALKQYLMRSWVENGRITSEIDWASPEPWTREVWEEFHFPFGAPFVHDGKSVFPPFFLMLSLPFFRFVGYAGLFILPAVSLMGLWSMTWLILRHAGVGGGHIALALIVLVLSPLTFFGMMFWEHTPGLFCLFAALALFARMSPKAWQDATAGFLLALAVMLRPELLIAATVLVVLTLLDRPRRPFALAGVAVGVVLWAAGNFATTGTPFGIHARQKLYLSGGGAAAKLLDYWVGVALEASAGHAAAFAALIATATMLVKRNGKDRRLDTAIVTMAGASVFLLPLMIPYSGEYLGFRRFELLLIPAGAIAAGRLAARDRRAVVILLALCLFQAPRFVRQYEIFRWANGPRLAPVIEQLEALRPPVVFTESQFTALELAWLMPRMALVWGVPPAELERLVGDVAAHTDIDRAALVFWQPGALSSLTIPVPGREPMRWVRLTGEDHGFALYVPEAAESRETGPIPGAAH